MTHYQNFYFYKTKYKLWSLHSRFVKPSSGSCNQSYMCSKQIYPSLVFINLSQRDPFLKKISPKFIKTKQPLQLVIQTDKDFRKLLVLNFNVTNKRQSLRISSFLLQLKKYKNNQFFYKYNFLFFYQRLILLPGVNQSFKQLQKQNVTFIQKVIQIEQYSFQTSFDRTSPAGQNICGQKINAHNKSIEALKFIKNCVISTKNYIKQPLLNSFFTRIYYFHKARMLPNSKRIISNRKAWENSSTWKNIQAKFVFGCCQLSFAQKYKTVNKHSYRQYFLVNPNFIYFHKLRICLFIFLRHTFVAHAVNVLYDKSFKIKTYNLINEAKHYLIKNLIKKNKNIPHSILVVYLNIFLNFYQFFFKILIRYFFEHKKYANINIKNFIIKLLIIKEKTVSLFCMMRVCSMGKKKLKNKNIARNVMCLPIKQVHNIASKEYCHWISMNLYQPPKEIGIAKDKKNQINTEKFNSCFYLRQRGFVPERQIRNITLCVYPCICPHQFAFECIKQKIFWGPPIFKGDVFFSQRHFCLVRNTPHMSQIKIRQKFLFLERFNRHSPFNLTKSLPILWQMCKKTQNQNTLYFIFRKYWLKLRTYYFYNSIKKGNNKKIKKKSNYTLFFKNILITKYNRNGQIKFSPFVLQLFYEQNPTIDILCLPIRQTQLVTKQQEQSLLLTKSIGLFYRKKIFFSNQLMLSICPMGKRNHDLFFEKNKRFCIRYLFFFKKLKKIKNLNKILKIFLTKNNKVIEHKNYLYTSYFNTCF